MDRKIYMFSGKNMIKLLKINMFSGKIIKKIYGTCFLVKYDKIIFKKSSEIWENY